MGTTLYFVGMHNKPGMRPLDSRTMTGKVIDDIIAALRIPAIKTNLCDCDYIPLPMEIEQEANAWHQRNDPSSEDVVVLLGAWVQANFKSAGLAVVKLGHPAGVRGHAKRKEYLKSATDKIKSALNI